MDIALVITRTIHFATAISLAGAIGFSAIVTAPAYVAANLPIPGDLRRRLLLIGWTSLVLTMVSAVPWLVFVARGMSGATFPGLLTSGVVPTVLARTQFGHAWILRMILAGLLVPALATMEKSRGISIGAVFLSAALLATTAWAGHAGADLAWEGFVHAAADAVHVIAAAGWVGALLPLALFLAEIRRKSDRSTLVIARAVTLGFSDLGLTCVAALLITGVINTWFLAGTLAALIATPYGRLLLAKIALFACMVAVAALNRQRLVPRLAVTDRGPRAISSREALRQIQRNVLIEALMGLAVIAIVGALGTMTPGIHDQPWWPFSYRLGFDNIALDPDLRKDAIGTTVLAALGLLLLSLGMRRRHALPIVTGLVLFVGLGWRPIQLLLVEATPASYAASPEPFAVRSILAGGAIYAQNCIACHGAGGQGDGPLATSLATAPSDLTAPHLFFHTEGDLFWFIGHGMAGGVMPGFAASLDESQRWHLVNFLKARAAGYEAVTLRATVTTDPAPRAPDFAFPSNSASPGTLRSLLTESAVLLILDDGSPSSLGKQFDDWRSVLAENGVAVLASDDHALRSVFAFYDDKSPSTAAELGQSIAFLIDRDGYIRARWHRGDEPDWLNLETLTREITTMHRLELSPVARATHAH